MNWLRDSLMSIKSGDYAIARTDDMGCCCFLLFFGKTVISSCWTTSKLDKARADAITVLKRQAEVHAKEHRDDPRPVHHSKFQ